jgi:hypothetical protein
MAGFRLFNDAVFIAETPKVRRKLRTPNYHELEKAV